jgi:Ca2+-binding RTX toxin-like protein
MVSDAQDLTRFGQALFAGDLLQPETLQQMLTLVPTPNSNTFDGYGLGIARLRTVEGVVYGHNGLTLGHRSNLWYSPDEDFTYVDLQNTRIFTNYVAPLITTYRTESAPAPAPVPILDPLIYGDAGNDVFVTGDQNVTIYAGEGNNTLTTGRGNDLLYGGADNDVIQAGDGNNIVYAGDGQNLVITGAGNDLIHTGAGNDIIRAGSGDDIIYAGEGNNQIDAGTGLDLVYSGAGADVFTLNRGEGFVTIFGVQTNDRFALGTGLTRRDLAFAQDGNDTIIAAGSDQLAVVKFTQASAIELLVAAV